ncbi:MAG: hypothetical protein NT070_22175 [Cyanobacteria bacterium]|nr:hypothetical protein [Cyanobacteriota bacterium]
MLRMGSPFLYWVIAFCSMTFAQVEPAIAGGIVSPQVLPLPAEDVPPIF